MLPRYKNSHIFRAVPLLSLTALCFKHQRKYIGRAVTVLLRNGLSCCLHLMVVSHCVMATDSLFNHQRPMYHSQLEVELLTV